MDRFFRHFRELLASEGGATAAEYVLMASLVAAACLAAVSAFGGAVGGLYRAALSGFG